MPTSIKSLSFSVAAGVAAAAVVNNAWKAITRDIRYRVAH